MANEHEHHEHKEHHEDKERHEHKAPKEKYIYFVDGEKYESDEAHTTGAIIKAKLPEAKRGYALWLEGHGDEVDKLINVDTSVDLKGKEPKRFYTVPPANFGLA